MHGLHRSVVGCALALAGPLHAEGQDIVNIINFIRGVEPRSNVNLIEPVQRQLDLAEQHNLPTTWLIQYDALINPQFTNLLKQQMGPNDEIGAWIEVVQPQVEAAGLTWRGRFPWDWHVNVGFTQGYSVADRKKVMDVYMAKFHEVFGYYPKSAGCWIIDAPTLNYLHDQYGVEAACNCKDQSGTDGYTLWGGYWNQAYYPSRLNAYMPAQTADQQLNVPVFRMLGSDPVHQYDQGIGTTWQGVVTLEPVYRPGGGDPDWVNWFFDTNFNQPGLGFSYMQAGQENSFGWPAMSSGLTDQYAKLAALRNQGKIRVETLKASGTWFRQSYEKTPATSVVALEDSVGDPKRSIWYESRFYRVNLYWEGNNWRIRDLHVFDEDYAERYLKSRETTAVATYDTLPVLDGFHWSQPGSIAGIYPVSAAGLQAIATTGVPVVTEVDEDSLRVTCALASGGQLVIDCDPDQLRFEMEGAPDWSLDLTWAAGRATSVAGVSEHAIGYQHQGFPYTLQCGNSVVTRNGSANRISIADAEGAVTFSFDPDRATAFWDGNGTQAGAGASPSGEWSDSALRWNTAADGTAAVVAWPGEDHEAVFAAGDDAAGPYTVNVEGVQEAASLEARSGQVTLNGGEIRLNHPAILRAESGAGLTVGSQLGGNSGLVLQGDGDLRLGGQIGISGPAYISASALTLEPGTSFPNLSRLGIGRSVPVALANAAITASGPMEAEDGAELSFSNTYLNFAGRIGLTGARLSAMGQTKIQAERFSLAGGDEEAGVSLGGNSELVLSGAGGNGVFELNSGSLTLADSATIQSRWFANRGEDASVSIAGNARVVLSDRLVLGDAAGAEVHVTQNGGSVTNAGTENNPSAGNLANRWGHWPNAATIYEIHSGSLNLSGAPLYLSWDSTATLDISGSASVSLKGVEMGWGGRNSSSLLRMNGGELKIGSHGIVGGTAGSKVVEFQGGTLGSVAAWASSVAVSVPGALTVDTRGGDITLTGALTGNGSLTKVGTGTLALSGPNQLAGGAAVEGGRLRLTGSSELDVEVGPAGNLATGGATIASLRLARGATLEFEVGGVERSLTVADAGGLALDGVHRVRIRPQPGIGPGTYPLLHYAGAPLGSGNFELIETPGLDASLQLDAMDTTLKLVVVSADASSALELKELFDNIAGPDPGTNGPLNGKGNSAASLGMAGLWSATSNNISTASNFNIDSNLPGLPSSQGSRGGVWNATNSYAVSIRATRELALPVDFAADRSIYFSFRANNSGDTAMGIGWSAGTSDTAEFTGAGLSWNNARTISTGENDAGNSAYVAYGTLSTNNGPYGIRAHEPQGSINGRALIVGRLSTSATGPDWIEIKRYASGSAIDADPSEVAWSARYSFDSSMLATHLLLWLNGMNGSGTGELDAIRMGASWGSVTGVYDPYGEWIARAPHFLSGAAALPQADPDGDGIPNGIEFVIGGNPSLANDRHLLPEASTEDDRLLFRFPLRAAANIEPFPFAEFGTDLGSWAPVFPGMDGVEIQTVLNGAAAGVDLVTVFLPAASVLLDGGCFMRLNDGR